MLRGRSSESTTPLTKRCERRWGQYGVNIIESSFLPRNLPAPINPPLHLPSSLVRYVRIWTRSGPCDCINSRPAPIALREMHLFVRRVFPPWTFLSLLTSSDQAQMYTSLLFPHLSSRAKIPPDPTHAELLPVEGRNEEEHLQIQGCVCTEVKPVAGVVVGVGDKSGGPGVV